MPWRVTSLGVRALDSGKSTTSPTRKSLSVSDRDYRLRVLSLYEAPTARWVMPSRLLVSVSLAGACANLGRRRRRLALRRRPLPPPLLPLPRLLLGVSQGRCEI